MAFITVGAREVSHDEARQWLTEYFDEETNRKAKDPYAYPAYDEFNAGSGPNKLNDGDLLAPGMLNAAPTITAFYSLQRIREHLQQRLTTIDVSLTLADAVNDGSVGALLGGLVDVLDAKDRPYGVRLTTLLKILHRKRPLFVPLYDKYVKACYLGKGDQFPVQRRRSRTTADYCVDIAKAINEDLTLQDAAFTELASVVPAGISPLRVIDILVWKAGRRRVVSADAGSSRARTRDTP